MNNPQSLEGAADRRCPEFLAYLLGVRVVQVVEDPQRLPPGLLSLLALTGRETIIANMVKRDRMTEYVSYLSEKRGSAQIATRGLGVVPESLVNEAESVQGGGLAGAIAELTVQGKSLLTAGDRLLVVAELSEAPAVIVECGGLFPLHAGSPVHGSGLLGVKGGFAESALPFKHKGSALMGIRLANLVAEFLVQAERPREVVVSLIVRAKPGAADA
jgi:hypothetical protein